MDPPLVHWRVEPMKPSDAEFCARSLKFTVEKAIRMNAWAANTPVVLMSDAPDDSLCINKTCHGWSSRGPYSAPDVRKQLLWLKKIGWYKADAHWTHSASLLRTSSLARFLAEYEMAISATLFVACTSGPCLRCSQGRASAASILDVENATS